MIGEIRQNFTEASASVGLILATALASNVGACTQATKAAVRRPPSHWMNRKVISYLIRLLRYPLYQILMHLFRSEPRAASESKLLYGN